MAGFNAPTDSTRFLTLSLIILAGQTQRTLFSPVDIEKNLENICGSVKNTDGRNIKDSERVESDALTLSSICDVATSRFFRSAGMSNLRVLAGLMLIPMAFAAEVAASPSPVASGDWNAIHRQMGATGKNGYRPMTSRAYQSSARFHSRALNSYGAECQQVPVETAREHLTQVQSSVAAVKKEIKKIDSETATKAGIQEDVAAIMKQLDECEKMCGMADKAIAGEKVENAPVCAHCTSIEKQLLAIRKSEDAMLKKLGISIPDDEHADHKDHEHDAKQ